MRNVNYKSDFDFIMRLKDCADDTKTVPFPECDFDAVFWTSSKTKAYIASCKGGVCTNCFRTKDGDMHFVFDNQHMGLGTLHWEPHFELPNDLYPDSIQDLFRKASLDIKLVDGDGDCPTTAEVELIAPFIKGDKGDSFTYDDFTTEDKAELIAPIKDNIDRAITQKQDKLTTSVDLNISEDKVLSLTERAKQRLFDDMWRTAAGEYGTVDHTHVEEDGTPSPYYLNELWLTYEEAMAVYDYGPITTTSATLRYANAKIRTNLPMRVSSWGKGSSSTKFNIEDIIGKSDIEILNLSVPKGSYAFTPVNTVVNNTGFRSKALRKIIGVVDIGNASPASGFKLVGELPELVDFRFMTLSYDTSFAQVPKMSADSLKYLVNNRNKADFKGAITLTLHPDVYAKVTSAVDDPEDEWYGLIDLAAAKQITFACA